MGFFDLGCIPWSGWLPPAFAHSSKPEHKDVAYCIGTDLNRTVGNLAGRIEEFGLLNVDWFFVIERTFFAVGIELVVSAVDLHHKTHQFASGRKLCSVEQFVVSFWYDNVGNIVGYCIINSFVNARS